MKAGIPMDSDRFAHLKDLLIEIACLLLPVSSGSASLAGPQFRFQPPPPRTQHADFPWSAFADG